MCARQRGQRGWGSLAWKLKLSSWGRLPAINHGEGNDDHIGETFYWLIFTNHAFTNHEFQLQCNNIIYIYNILYMKYNIHADWLIDPKLLWWLNNIQQLHHWSFSAQQLPWKRVGLGHGEGKSLFVEGVGWGANQLVSRLGWNSLYFTYLNYAEAGVCGLVPESGIANQSVGLSLKPVFFTFLRN